MKLYCEKCGFSISGDESFIRRKLIVERAYKEGEAHCMNCGAKIKEIETVAEFIVALHNGGKASADIAEALSVVTGNKYTAEQIDHVIKNKN